MTYDGSGEVSAVHVPAGSAPELQIGSTTGVLVAPGGLTNQEFGLFRWDMTAPGGADPHFHRTFSESFYVLSGSVGIYDGDSWRATGAGDFSYVPAGGIHGFRNEVDASSMLILFSPGPPRELYFQELAAIIAEGRKLTDDEWTELYARHDQYMV